VGIEKVPAARDAFGWADVVPSTGASDVGGAPAVVGAHEIATKRLSEAIALDM